MKIDRLIGIITILTQNEKTTAPYLAERFEVSRRTILRDINTLCQAGIPIVTVQGGDGGISITDGYKLDKSILTADDLSNIITGLKSIDSISNTSNLERLMLKIAPNNKAVISLSDNILIDLPSDYKDSLPEKIDIIKQAIKDKKIIEFDYYSAKGDAKRRIEPYFIIFKWASWYVFGFCIERQDFRLFKLNRLWKISVADESYTERQIPSEKQILRNIEEINHVEILFDRSMRFRLIEEYGLNSYTETDRGLLLSRGYTNKDYIISWVLQFGDKAEIISPDDIRNEYRRIIKNMFKRINEK